MLAVGVVIWLTLVGCADAAKHAWTPIGPVQTWEITPGVPSCTVTEAWHAWHADPVAVKILDVRTPGEYIYVGHVPGARNIPWKLLENRWDDQRQAPAMKPNPTFLEAVRKAYRPDELLLVMCRSGRRSADAVKTLRAAGYAKAISVDGGFEGEFGKDCDCATREKMVKKGWKAMDYPWTLAVEAKEMWTD